MALKMKYKDYIESIELTSEELKVFNIIDSQNGSCLGFACRECPFRGKLSYACDISSPIEREISKNRKEIIQDIKNELEFRKQWKELLDEK